MTLRALRRHCPHCGAGAISRHIWHVELVCPRCGLDLERQVGSFIGGVGLNTSLSFIALLTVLVLGFVRTGGEASVTGILVPALAVAIVLPLVLHVRTRLLWVALELRFWPLTDDELAQRAEHHAET